MELKKNPKADLERSKGIFFLVGLVFSLAAILVAFQVSSTQSVVDDLEQVEQLDFEDEIVERTRQEPIPPEKVPPPQQVVEVLKIVDNSEELDDDGFDFSDEIDPNDEIVLPPPTAPKVEEKEEEIFMIVEKMPVFPGGELGLRKYIAENVKYPHVARETGIEGKVYVRFCVTSTGAVEKVVIARGVDPILDKEAIRVVKDLPRWKPGEQRGKKVSVWYTVPINFKLSN